MSALAAIQEKYYLRNLRATLNEDHAFLSVGKKEQCSRAYRKEQTVRSMLSAATSNTELIQAKKILHNY